MALRHAAALVAAFILCVGAPAVAVELAQNAPITTPPKLILPPGALPDLEVTKVAATVKCTDGHYFTATIAATVVNKGKGTADLTKIHNELEANWWPTKGQGFLDGSANQTIKPMANGPLLKSGQSWSVTLEIKQIPEYKKSAPKQWQYVFAVEIDLANQMPESNEKNNGNGTYALDPCPK